MVSKNTKSNANTNTEKVLYQYIRERPEWFSQIEPSFFETPLLSFMYRITRDAYLTSHSGRVPSQTEIRDLCVLEDPSGNYPKDAIVTVLKSSIDDYSEVDFILPKIYAWAAKKRFYSGYAKTLEIVKEIRDTDLTLDEIEERKKKIKEMLDAAQMLNLDSDNTIASLRDPEAHFQPLPTDRISTGYPLLNEMLGGGWRKKTLNLLAGMSGSGKSLWMCNFAANAVRDGKNVLYISLEMSREEVMKRVGSNLFSLNIDEFDAASRDSHRMRQIIRSWENSRDTSIGQTPFGELWVEELPKGNAADVDRIIEAVQRKSDKKIEMVFVDYTQIMSTITKGQVSMFEKGKEIAEDLRAIAMRRDLCMVSANQISKDQYEANRMSLADLSESKAYGDTADFVFAIIRTEAMKEAKKYALQGLKFRSTSFNTDRIFFDLNEEYLRIENDRIAA